MPQTRIPDGVVPTPEQQRVLDRIALQRQRLRERRAQAERSAAQAQAQATAEPGLQRVLEFARAHPSLVAGAVGVALWAGPRRLLRWGSTLLPLLLKLRR
ncbi:MAG: hypothetical protein ACK40S_04245 [Burkholderiaceae bacterium]